MCIVAFVVGGDKDGNDVVDKVDNTAHGFRPKRQFLLLLRPLKDPKRSNVSV